jgi:hypothetical protein
MNRFKHAFALDEGNAEPTPSQKQVAEAVCREIVRRRLATPALLFLETFRPLNYLGSQLMHFFQPIVNIVLDGEGYRHLSEFLENRASVDYLRRRIEDLEDEGGRARTKRKQARAGKGEIGNPTP